VGAAQCNDAGGGSAARSSAAGRAAFLCLLALAVCVPLTPASQSSVAGKQIVFLALSSLGVVLLCADALRRAVAPAVGTPTDWALLAFLCAALPAGLLAVNRGMATFTAGVLAALGLTYLLAIQTLRDAARVRRLYAAVLAAAVIVAGFGLLGFRRFVADDAAESLRRQYLATPFFPHSYLAAQYLVPVLAGGLVLLFERGLGRAGSLVVALALLPIGAFLLVTGSRGAYLAVTVALLLHLVLGVRAAAAAGRSPGAGRRLLARAALFLAVALVALALASLAGLLPGGARHALERVLLVFDPQAREFNFSRLALWRDTLRMAGDHLLFGVGPGCFDTALPAYHRAVPHAHNQFLHVLAELGLFGLLPFLLLLRHARRAVVRGAAHLSGDAGRRPLFLAAVAALAATLVYFLFETPLVWPEAGGLVMMLLALVTRAGCLDRERPGRPALAAGALAALALLLAALAPPWIAYARAGEKLRLHLAETTAARACELAGDEEGRRGHMALAAGLLDQADALFPWRPEFQELRAEILSGQGRYSEALEATRVAEARSPGNVRNLSTMGTLLVVLGHPDQALDPLRRAIASDDGLAAAATSVRLGRALYDTGRFEAAWAVFSTLIGPPVYYDSTDPTLLLDAVRTLIALDRNLHEARPLLALYRERAPGQDEAVVAYLERQLDELRARPRRPFHRTPSGGSGDGGSGGDGPADPGDPPPVH